MLIALVKFVGFLMVASGVVFFLNPAWLKRLLVVWEKGKRMRLAGLIRIIFAAILLIGAPQCRVTGVIATLGIVILISGISLLVLSLDRLRAMLRWWHERSPAIFRLAALMAVGLGTLILYAI